jgi:hypothetical protein
MFRNPRSTVGLIYRTTHLSTLTNWDFGKAGKNKAALCSTRNNIP